MKSALMRIVIWSLYLFISGVTIFIADYAFATPTCTPYSYYVGMEYLATSCPSQNSNDSTPYTYLVNNIICYNTTQTNASWGNSYGTPNDIVNYYVDKDYRVFRNAKGTRLLIINAGYNGTIGDVNTGQYQAGYYTDVINEVLSSDVTQPCCLSTTTPSASAAVKPL